MDADLEVICPMVAEDIELWSLDPTRNRFRVYALSEGRTLFGEPYLWLVWGRLGSGLRERTEIFRSRGALLRRRTELVSLRRKHGYFWPETLGAARRMLFDEGVREARRPVRRIRVACAAQAALPFEGRC
jgi:hypothetical protein